MGLRKIYGILSALQVWTYGVRRLTDAVQVFGVNSARTLVPLGTILAWTYPAPNECFMMFMTIDVGQTLLCDVQLDNGAGTWDIAFDFGPLGGGVPWQTPKAFPCIGYRTRFRNNTAGPVQVTESRISYRGV